jgi:hypothetical protein
MLKRFWLAKTVVVDMDDILKQINDASEELLVGLLPVKIVFARLRREHEVHEAPKFLRDRFVPFPVSMLWIAAISLLAFVGERGRYAGYPS